METGVVEACFFLPYEAEIIGGIALSSSPQKDKQIWAPTTTGLFSVRTAYWIAMGEVSNGGPTNVSNDSSQRKFWKYLWSINLPHKVRHFAWRHAETYYLRRKI